MNYELAALQRRLQTASGPVRDAALADLKAQHRLLKIARHKLTSPEFARNPEDALWRQEVRSRFRELNATGTGDALIQTADEVTCRALLETPHWLAGLSAGQLEALQARLLALQADEVTRLDTLESDLNQLQGTIQ